MDEWFGKITNCFASELTDAAESCYEDLNEIRIRADLPVVIYCGGRACFSDAAGKISDRLPRDPLMFSRFRLTEAFSRICDFSLYRHMDTLRDGFITAAGGHRIGICGTAVTERGDIRSIKDITSLNVRRAREYKGCSDVLIGKVSKGALIAGRPSSGKTTLLRDLGRRLSSNALYKVSLIDERMEIASHGADSFDVGLCDVFCGYPKAHAFMTAIRTMSPDIIICDELTGDSLEAITAALHCGVKMIASVHTDSVESALRDPFIITLMKTGAFPKMIILDGNIPPRVSDTVTSEVFL